MIGWKPKYSNFDGNINNRTPVKPSKMRFSGIKSGAAKENAFGDEKIRKWGKSRGINNQMQTITSFKKPRIPKAAKTDTICFNRLNQSYQDRIPKSINDEMSLFNRFKLESAFYRIFKIVVLLMTVTFLEYGGVSPFNGISVFTICFGGSVLLLLSMLDIPKLDLIPVRKYRRKVKRFLKAELRFILLVCVVLFFGSVRISPLYIFILFCLNFIMQSALFVLWYMYNTKSIKPQNLRRASKSEKKVIIIGASWRGKKAADLFLEYPDLNARILGFVDYHKDSMWRYRDIPLMGHPDLMTDIILKNQVDYVVMAAEPGDFLLSRELFVLLEKMGINICILPDIYEHKVSKCHASSINGQPVLKYCSTRSCAGDQLLKTIIDKIGAFFGLLIASPLLIISAIAIKLDSRGPVFFMQERSGKNGRTFNMLKLRTMENGADKKKKELQHLNEMSGPVFKINNDPRITRIGKLIRKYSIDEFPQFINVLKGDMSLVGPRPPLPAEVAKYEPWQRRKLSVKPGATCLWQINGRNQVDFNKWMELDLQYIDNWSLEQDIKILFQTIPAVIKGNGAS